MHDSTPSHPKVPLWLLVLVTLAGTLAMHMFIPALPDAAHHLGATSGQMQQTITVYILGLAAGQLVYGPLSDSLGRRPMLLAGLGLYTAASLVALLAPNTGTLVGARLLQALGGCAGLALGRAIARDTSTPENAVGTLALLNLMMMIGPGIAPSIGSAVDGLFGWRAIFGLLSVMGLVTLIGVWKLLPETGKPTGQLRWRSVRDDYRTLLGTPQFVGLAIGGGCATTGLYAFVAAAPFIFMNELHASKQQVGLYLGVLMAGMAIGNALARQLIRRWPLERLMISGNLLGLVCVALLLLLTVLHQLSVPAVLIMIPGASTYRAMVAIINRDPLSTLEQGTASLGGIDGAPERLAGAFVSADAFAVLGVAPVLGRSISEADMPGWGNPKASPQPLTPLSPIASTSVEYWPLRSMR